jgi:hypothetical protein
MKVHVTKEAFAGSGWTDVVRYMHKEGKGPATITFKASIDEKTDGFLMELDCEDLKKFDHKGEMGEVIRWALSITLNYVIVMLGASKRHDLAVSLMSEVWADIKEQHHPAYVVTFTSEDGDTYIQHDEKGPGLAFKAMKIAFVELMLRTGMQQHKINRVRAFFKTL